MFGFDCVKKAHTAFFCAGASAYGSGFPCVSDSARTSGSFCAGETFCAPSSSLPVGIPDTVNAVSVFVPCSSVYALHAASIFSCIDGRIAAVRSRRNGRIAFIRTRIAAIPCVGRTIRSRVTHFVLRISLIITGLLRKTVSILRGILHSVLLSLIHVILFPVIGIIGLSRLPGSE